MKLKQKWRCIGVLLLLAVSRPERAKAQDVDDDLKITFRNAVVKVDVSSNTPVIRDGVNVCNSEGTGFLISSSHVATAAHVIQIPSECGKPLIILKSRKHNNMMRLAEVIASRDDVALLKANQEFPTPMCALVPLKADIYDVKGIRFGIPGQFADPVPNPVQIGEKDSEFDPYVRLNSSPAESGESGGPVVYKFNVVGVLKAKHKQYVGFSFMMVASMLRTLMVEKHVVTDGRICNPVELSAFFTPPTTSALQPTSLSVRPNNELNAKTKQAVSQTISKVSEELAATDNQIQLSSENAALVISAFDRIESKLECSPAPGGAQVCNDVPVRISGAETAQRAATSIKDKVTDQLWQQTVSSALDTLMSDAISQSQKMVSLMTQSCPGGRNGVNPAHFDAFQGYSNEVQKTLVEIRLGLAKGQTSNLGPQIDSVKGLLEKMVVLMHQSCSGGAHGEDPFHYSEIVDIKNKLEGKLEAVK
ncbi:hypothetical protein ACVIQT_005970 [Bradyrhizobium diazoefficiens]